MNEFNKYFSKCGLIGELPEKISTLAPELTLEMMQDAYDRIDKEWEKQMAQASLEDFWCKASWLVIGITLGLVVAMVLL